MPSKNLVKLSDITVDGWFRFASLDKPEYEGKFYVERHSNGNCIIVSNKGRQDFIVDNPDVIPLIHIEEDWRDNDGTMSLAEAMGKAEHRITLNIIYLLSVYEDNVNSFPAQSRYWNNRIKEIEDALKPMLEKGAHSDQE